MKRAIGSAFVLGFMTAVIVLHGVAAPALATEPSGYWKLTRVEVHPADDDQMDVAYGDGFGTVSFRPQVGTVQDEEGRTLSYRQETKASWVFSPRKYLRVPGTLRVTTTLKTTLKGPGLALAGFTGEPDGMFTASLSGLVVGLDDDIASVTLRTSGERCVHEPVAVPPMAPTSGDEMILSMSATSTVNSLGANVNHVFVWQGGPVPGDDARP